MKLPFMLDDSDWRNLAPKKTETLGEDPSLDPQMKLMYHTMRELDHRSEWSCSNIVKMNNRQVYIMIALGVILLASGPQVLKVLSDIITVVF